MKHKLIAALILLSLLITSSGTVFAQELQPPVASDDPRTLLENPYWFQPIGQPSAAAWKTGNKPVAPEVNAGLISTGPAGSEIVPAELTTIINGNFEQGQNVGWSEFSSGGYDVVVPYSPDIGVVPYSGTWMAWFGGDDLEVTTLGQANITISGLNVLQLWYWAASGDLCNFDFGYVKINSSIVHTWDLCYDNNTYGWYPLEIDLSAYESQTITVSIEVTTDESIPSGLLIDDVAFFNSHDGETVGVFRPSNGVIFLKRTNRSGFADMALNYGIPGDYPVTGDWNGDDIDTIGIYRDGRFYLRNSNTVGFADITLAFGLPGDQPIAGDWDGDGDDTIGVYRPSTGQFLLRNSNTGGFADLSFYLGNVGDVGIAGDWDGDGTDTVGVFRPSNGIIFLKNTNTTGFADIALNYGIPGDKSVVGDWDNDGDTTIGVYRNGRFYLRNSNTVGFADIVFDLGNPGDMPIGGDWDALP